MMRIILATCLFVAFQTSAADKLLFEERAKIIALLGPPVERVENARAPLPSMDVQRFRKEGWEYVIYFHTDRADRIIISKQDGTALSDEEILPFLVPNKSFNGWGHWNLLHRRAWISEGKIGPFYALVTTADRSFELITDRYLRNLARHVWLESTEPRNEKQP
jgi:hypothetical protein